MSRGGFNLADRPCACERGNSMFVTLGCGFSSSSSSRFITASYNRSISCCRASLSASRTFESNEAMLSGAGLLASLFDLRLLLALFLLFDLFGLYHGRCAEFGETGEGSKFLLEGLTSSMPSVPCDDCASFLSRRPTVNRRIPMMATDAKYAPTIPQI